MTMNDDTLVQTLEALRGTRVRFFHQAGNAGDGLIAYATYLAMQRHGIKYETMHNWDDVHGATILVGGGGNLIEGRYAETAEFIRRHASRNRLILLPHTVSGYADVLQETHRNLTVFCREPVSHALALLAGAKPANTHLAHDMVFYLEDDHFAPWEMGTGSLAAMRQDGESSGFAPVPQGNIDISSSWNGELWQNEKFTRAVVDSLRCFIEPFRQVQTDRLHVSILSALLGKEVFFFPNAYYKNRAVFEHSMSARFPKVRFVNTGTDLPHGGYVEEQVRDLQTRVESMTGAAPTRASES